MFEFFSDGAASPWGPALCAAGGIAGLGGVFIHGVCGRPTILRARNNDSQEEPNGWERISIHTLVYGTWAIAFGAVIWRGIPGGMIDVRLPFERRWGVIENVEWIYLSLYLMPLFMPWLAVSRAVLRRYVLDLGWILAASLVLFLVLPVGSPPRPFVATSLAGKILAWEIQRADFAAAALPSFHVLWALVCARLLAARWKDRAWIAWAWALLVAAAAVANGAHALVDVLASFALYFLVTGKRSPVSPWLRRVEAKLTGVIR